MSNPSLTPDLSTDAVTHDLRIEYSTQLYRALLGDFEVGRAEMCGGEWWLDVADEVTDGLGLSLAAIQTASGGFRMSTDIAARAALEMIGRLYAKAVEK